MKFKDVEPYTWLKYKNIYWFVIGKEPDVCYLESMSDEYAYQLVIMTSIVLNLFSHQCFILMKMFYVLVIVKKSFKIKS